MTEPTLREARDHLRVTESDDDALIGIYLAAAREELARYIGAELPDPLPADLGFAILEMVAYAYDNRGDHNAKPGLIPSAARIAARYCRVTL